jgi:tetratricopeptide (TPR) repeat protein
MTQTMDNNPSPVEDDDLFFNDLIESYVKSNRFVERHWLLEKIEKHISDRDCRIILLTAEPGAGKTAFMAWLANQHADWLRYFIRKDSKEVLRGGDAQSFLLTIGHQLAIVHPSIFKPDKLEVIVEQRLGKITSTGSAVGISVDELYTSPFYQTSLSVRQDAETIEGKLTGVSIKKLVADARLLPNEKLQYLGLFDPAKILSKADATAKIIILIDGLDELRFSHIVDDILKWLSGLGISEIPSNIRFVIASRPLEEHNLNILRERFGKSLREVEVDTSSKNVQEDLHSYAEYFVCQQLIKPVLSMHGIDSKKFAERSVAKANGNFQYLSFLYRGIEQKIKQPKEKEKTGSTIPKEDQELTKLLSFEDVPTGLRSLYDFFIDRLKASVSGTAVEIPGEGLYGKSVYVPAWEGLYRPILGVMSVAAQPLDSFQIRNFIGFRGEEGWLNEALDRLGQFLDRHNGNTYTFYHSTFAESLISAPSQAIDSNNNAYKTKHFLNPSEWHQKIIGYYRGTAEKWDNVNWKNVDDYGLQKLALHLYALRDVEVSDVKVYRQEFYGLICKSFMQAKLERYDSLYFFAKDVELAFEAAHSEQPPNLLQLVRSSLIISTIQILSNEVPPGALCALTLIGNDKKAIGIAGLIAKGSTKRIEAYVYIGQALLYRQEIDKAIDVLVPLFRENHDIPYTKFYLTRLVPFIAQIQGLDHLVKVAKAIGTDKSQEYWWILSSVALQLVFEDKDKKAFEVVERIKNLNAKARALGVIAQTFSLKGKIVRAREAINQLLKLAKSIEDTLSKAQALSEMAGALAQIGEKEKITDIIKQMRAMTRWTTNEQDKGTILSLLALVLAQASKCKELSKVSLQVQRIAEGTKDESIRENMLNRIVVALDLIDAHEAAVWVGSLTKYHTDILNLVGGVTNGEGYNLYHGKYVTVKLKDLDEDSIISTWEPWMPSGVKFTGFFDRIDYRHIGYVDQIGDIENALAKAEKSDELYKRNALASIAELLFLGMRRNGFFSIALPLKGSIADRMQKVAETISNEQYRSHVLGSVALAFAVENMDSKAEEIADKALKIAGAYEYGLDLSSKEQTLAAIAKSLAQYQKFDEAQKIADQINNNWEKAKVLKVIVRELAKTNLQQDKAVKVANQILSMVKETGDNSSIGAIAIEALTWAGKVKQAQEMVQNIKPGLTTKADRLVDMALALAELGKSPESIKLAKTAQTYIIKHKLKDLESLEKLAKAFAKAYEFDRALETIRKIDSKELQQKALMYTACAFINAGNKEKAKEIADQALSTFAEFGSAKTVRNNRHAPTPKLPVDSLTWAEVSCLLDDCLDKRWEPNSMVQAVFPQIMPPQFEETLNTFDQKLREKGSTITRWELGFLPSMAYMLTISGQVERALSLFIKTLILIHDKPLKEDINNPLGEPGYLRASKLNATFMVLGGYIPLIASVDQGQTLWKIYQAIVEVEGWLTV